MGKINSFQEGGPSTQLMLSTYHWMPPRNTNGESLHLSCYSSSRCVHQQVSSMQEHEHQTTDEKHPMFNQSAAPKRLRSRGSLLSKVHSLGTVSKEAERLALWKEKSPNSLAMGLQPSEQLTTGADSPWPEWRCFNRLRSGVRRCKVALQKWGYLPQGQGTTCECGTAPKTMEHLLVLSTDGATLHTRGPS